MKDARYHCRFIKGLTDSKKRHSSIYWFR